MMNELVFLVVLFALAFALSPGVLLTLPPHKGDKVKFLPLKDDKDNKSTSYLAALTHAGVLTLLCSIVLMILKSSE